MGPLNAGELVSTRGRPRLQLRVMLHFNSLLDGRVGGRTACGRAVPVHAVSRRLGRSRHPREAGATRTASSHDDLCVCALPRQGSGTSSALRPFFRELSCGTVPLAYHVNISIPRKPCLSTLFRDLDSADSVDRSALACTPAVWHEGQNGRHPQSHDSLDESAGCTC